MPDNYFANYLPLLIHFLLAGGFAVAVVTLSYFIGYRRPTRAKLSPYECGMVPVGDARGRFSVKFFMVAMLFILFDVRGGISVSVGGDPPPTQNVRILGNACLHRHCSGGLLLHMEEGRA